MKDPLVGGVWTWHQDYGYWYRNGVLWPLPVSVSVAIDPATRENGCLQVIPRSHELGRIDHLQSGDQAGDDMERANAVLERLPLGHCEMEPGDAVFFHPNMLHRSDMNRSQHPRWSMICCYNAARNDPYKDSHHPRYTPLDVVPDSQVREVGSRRFAYSSADVAWVHAADDHSAEAAAAEADG